VQVATSAAIVAGAFWASATPGSLTRFSAVVLTVYTVAAGLLAPSVRRAMSRSDRLPPPTPPVLRLVTSAPRDGMRS
jgi:hypothetical protein